MPSGKLVARYREPGVSDGQKHLLTGLIGCLGHDKQGTPYVNKHDTALREPALEPFGCVLTFQARSWSVMNTRSGEMALTD